MQWASSKAPTVIEGANQSERKVLMKQELQTVLDSFKEGK